MTTSAGDGHKGEHDTDPECPQHGVGGEPEEGKREEERAQGFGDELIGAAARASFKVDVPFRGHVSMRSVCAIGRHELGILDG